MVVVHPLTMCLSLAYLLAVRFFFHLECQELESDPEEVVLSGDVPVAVLLIVVVLVPVLGMGIDLRRGVTRQQYSTTHFTITGHSIHQQIHQSIHQSIFNRSLSPKHDQYLACYCSLFFLQLRYINQSTID